MSEVPDGVSIAAKLTDLLPSGNAELAPVSEGVYVGDGLPPVHLQNLQQKSGKESSYKWGSSSQSFGHPTGRRI